MTVEEIRRALFERAVRELGAARAEELQADMEQMAIELLRLHEHTIGFDDEP